MSVRAKFYVTNLDNPEGAAAAQVELGAVCRGVENALWSQATPAGYMRLNILNTPAYEQFEKGAEYLVTFTKVAKPEPGDGHQPQPTLNKHGWMVCEFCGQNLGATKGEVSEDQMAAHARMFDPEPETADATAE